MKIARYPLWQEQYIFCIFSILTFIFVLFFENFIHVYNETLSYLPQTSPLHLLPCPTPNTFHSQIQVPIFITDRVSTASMCMGCGAMLRRMGNLMV